MTSDSTPETRDATFTSPTKDSTDPAGRAAFDGNQCKTPGCCTCDLPHCPLCGYTRHDAAHLMDHRLCKGVIPPDDREPKPASPVTLSDERGDAEPVAWGTASKQDGRLVAACPMRYELLPVQEAGWEIVPLYRGATSAWLPSILSRHGSLGLPDDPREAVSVLVDERAAGRREPSQTAMDAWSAWRDRNIYLDRNRPDALMVAYLAGYTVSLKYARNTIIQSSGSSFAKNDAELNALIKFRDKLLQHLTRN